MIEETAGGHENIALATAAAARQTPEIERFDRVRAAIHDKRGGSGGGGGSGRPHNAFVGSGGVGMEDHGGGAGDRVRSVCVTARLTNGKFSPSWTWSPNVCLLERD